MIIPNLHRYYNNADSENRNISMTRIWFQAPEQQGHACGFA
jgi:hypothetical protein